MASKNEASPRLEAENPSNLLKRALIPVPTTLPPIIPPPPTTAQPPPTPTPQPTPTPAPPTQPPAITQPSSSQAQPPTIIPPTTQPTLSPQPPIVSTPLSQPSQLTPLISNTISHNAPIITTTINAPNAHAHNNGLTNSSSSESTISSGIIAGLAISGVLVAGLIAFFVRKKLNVLKSNKSLTNDDFNQIFNVESAEQYTSNSNGNNSRRNNDRGRGAPKSDINNNRLNGRHTNMSRANNNNRGERVHNIASNPNIRTTNNRGGEMIHNFNDNRPLNNMSNPINMSRTNNIGVQNFNSVNAPFPPPLVSMNKVYTNQVPEVSTPYHPAISVAPIGVPSPPPGITYVHGISTPSRTTSPMTMNTLNNTGGYGVGNSRNNINKSPPPNLQYNLAGSNPIPPYNQYSRENVPTSNNDRLLAREYSQPTQQYPAPNYNSNSLGYESKIDSNVTINVIEPTPTTESTLYRQTDFDYGDYGQYRPM